MKHVHEHLVPTLLLVVGLAIYVGHAFLTGDPDGTAAQLFVVGWQLVLNVVLGLIACAITGALMRTAFGRLRSAIFKLAAIFVFPAAVSLLIPSVPIAWLVSYALYFWLLTWLFDLEGWDVVVCAIVIWLVRIIAFAIGAALFAT